MTKEQREMRQRFERLAWHKITPAGLRELSDALAAIEGSAMTDEDAGFDLERWEPIAV